MSSNKLRRVSNKRISIVDCFISEIDLLILTISRRKTDRNLHDLIVISNYLEKTDFIKKLQSEKFDETSIKRLVQACAYNMEHISLNRGEYLFREGDIGDKFYIILTGSVSVYQLKEYEVRLTAEDYFIYLIKLKKKGEVENLRKTIKTNQSLFAILPEDENYLEDIIFTAKLRKLLNSNFDYDELHDLFRNFNQDMKTFIMSDPKTREDLRKGSFKRFNNSIIKLSPCKFSIEKYIYLDNTKESKLVKLFKEEFIVELQRGSFFGGNALETKNKIRSASIKLNENCNFGFVNQDVYTNYVLVEKQKMTNKETYYFINNYFPFISFDIFSDKFRQLFRDYEIAKNKTIFQQNEELTNLYFIKEGRVELNSNMNLYELQELVDYMISNFSGFSDEKDKRIDQRLINQEDALKRKNLKIMIYESKKILGLEEFFFKIPRFYKSIILSTEPKIHIISSKNFKGVIDDEKSLKFMKTIAKNNLNLIIRRLIKIRDFFYDEIKKKYLNDYKIYSSNKKETHTINFQFSINQNYAEHKNEEQKENLVMQRHNKSMIKFDFRDNDKTRKINTIILKIERTDNFELKSLKKSTKLLIKEVFRKREKKIFFSFNKTNLITSNDSKNLTNSHNGCKGSEKLEEKIKGYHRKIFSDFNKTIMTNFNEFEKSKIKLNFTLRNEKYTRNRDNMIWNEETDINDNSNIKHFPSFNNTVVIKKNKTIVVKRMKKT